MKINQNDAADYLDKRAIHSRLALSFIFAIKYHEGKIPLTDPI